MGATIKAGSWSYTLTESDKLWAARMCQTEGNGALYDPADVLWTMTQAYAQINVHRNHRTFASFVQSYSQPINPKWRRDGQFCRPGGEYAGRDECSELRLANRDRAATLQWSAIRPSVKSAVSSWFDGTLPNPVPKAVEFADPRVSQNFLDRTPGAVVVKRADNWYIATASSLRWSDRFVKMAGSAVMPILSVILGLGLGVGAAYFVRNRPGFLLSLSALSDGLRSSSYSSWENDYPGILVEMPGLPAQSARRIGKYVEEEFPGVTTEWLTSSSALEIRPKDLSRRFTPGDFAYWKKREPGFTVFLRQLV